MLDPVNRVIYLEGGNKIECHHFCPDNLDQRGIKSHNYKCYRFFYQEDMDTFSNNTATGR